MNAAAFPDFEAASLNHLRDVLRATPAERWRWLGEAMTFGFELARARATRGLVTLDPHGEILWSPSQEKAWVRNQPRAG